MYFFACPKKYQKRATGNDDGAFPVGIPIKLLHYCGFNSRAMIL
jgi:hypothetical protein